MKQVRKILGIVISAKTIAVSQIARSGDVIQADGSAEFTLSEGVTLENLAAVRNDFRTFLRTHHFTASKAVVGIPARQMMTTEVKLPDVSNDELRYGALRLNLERQLNIDVSELAFDCYGTAAGPDNHVLITAILKKTLTQIQELLEAAKITPIQVTNTSLGLDFQTGTGIRCHLIEYPESFELCLFDQNRLTGVQYVSKEPGTTLDAQMAQKITRIVNRTHWANSAQTSPIHYRLWTHDSGGHSVDGDAAVLLGGVEHRTLRYTLDTPLCSYAAELAARFTATGAFAVNYLNGHHERRRLFGSGWVKKATWGLAAVLVLIAAFLISWQYDRSTIVRLQQQLDSTDKDVAAARDMIDHVSRARPWFQTEPRYLELLRELTLSFPENSNIWLTSLATDESSNQVLTGRATREEAVLDVVESLQSNRRFEAVKILYIRKMGKETEMLTFAINLRSVEGS